MNDAFYCSKQEFCQEGEQLPVKINDFKKLEEDLGRINTLSTWKCNSDLHTKARHLSLGTI